MNDAKLEACTKPVKTKKPNTSPKVVAQRHRKMVGLVSGGAVGNLDSGGRQPVLNANHVLDGTAGNVCNGVHVG